jgi:hypothetical protein
MMGTSALQERAGIDAAMITSTSYFVRAANSSKS